MCRSFWPQASGCSPPPPSISCMWLALSCNLCCWSWWWTASTWWRSWWRSRKCTGTICKSSPILLFFDHCVPDAVSFIFYPNEMNLHNILLLIMGYYIPSSKNFINILKKFFLLLYINSGEENINIGCLSSQLRISLLRALELRQTSLNFKGPLIHKSSKSH